MTSLTYMDIFKKIKKLKGWNDYKMAQKLGIPQSSLKHYALKPVSTREKLLINLQEISGMSVDEFWNLLKHEVRQAKK